MYISVHVHIYYTKCKICIHYSSIRSGYGEHLISDPKVLCKYVIHRFQFVRKLIFFFASDTFRLNKIRF